ncbi:mandelate racemase/muconate lactonizing enzyme family protein [Oceaniglobus trochenteri]|uniref:mandelate racemase/muconate lactonizing enzyme family protein n=1 Tax=Oceaniglobus trochenteri TaxID=2763260 RepID=UPI001CFFB384|nr:mandelate racemase/muconate lactonizing enzyme family protein [Oceaniglobus trochenteri]
MKITAIETIRNEEWSNFLWVRVETDAGLVGLGETFRHVTPIARYVHDHLAPWLLGRDAGAVNAHDHAMRRHGGLRFSGYPTRSVEIRANSAVDIALWDLKARAAGMPLCDLLGGPVRDRIAIYNTCAGPSYNWQSGAERARIVQDGDAALAGDVPDDLAAQASDPGALAQSLLEEGITAMKIWPFDAAAEASGGHRISGDEMRAALSRIAAIRDAVGDRMDILLEYHGLWNAAPARRILAEVDEFNPFWHEDPIPMEEIATLAELRRGTKTPIAGSESHGTATWIRDALAAGAVDYLHFDIGWTGGISEALRIAHLAAAHDRLIAPHDCTGPVVWIANLHLAMSQPNALWLESVRAYYKGLYRRLVTELPKIEMGNALAMQGPGLGTELSEELLNHPATHIERTTG